MPNLIEDLTRKKLIAPPPYLAANIHYLTIMGSTAYGCADTNSDEESDWDIYGFFIPPKEFLFPHLTGEVWGFGKYHEGMPQSDRRRRVWQVHGVVDPSARGGRGREYDFQLYNITQYLHLCTENNPNMVDSLFTPETCVLHSTAVGNLIRDNRRKFLTLEVAAKFKGYAYAQVKKLLSKEPEEGSKRAALVEKFGWDVKFGYHVVRLAEEAEQILRTGDLDLTRSRELYKSIRRGEWSLAQLMEWFDRKKIHLEELVAESKLPAKPDWDWSRNLLVQALEMHYGDVSNCVTVPGKAEALVREIKDLIESRRF
jgi:predicted nucleotidyltransferase